MLFGLFRRIFPSLVAVLCLFTLSACSLKDLQPPAPQNTFLTPSNQCADLKEGQSQWVHAVGTPLRVTYELSRLDNGPIASRYHVRIPVSWKVSPGEPENLGQLMHDRAQACLNAASLKFVGPNDESLSIELINAPVSSSETEIEVTSKPIRVHWKKWSTLLGCDQVLHEVAHKLGLVDLYAEKKPYSCRVGAGATSSLLASPQRAFMSVGFQVPSNSRPFFGEGLPVPPRDSLFYPSEFEVITRPNCKTNEIYYACSAQAYLKDANQCGPLPQECEKGNTEWISEGL